MNTATGFMDTTNVGGPATAKTGSGGGGGPSYSTGGGQGGSGVVIVRYPRTK